MTATPEAGVDAACLQLFTWWYCEFTFVNDTVTASDLDRSPSFDSRNKRHLPRVEKVAGGPRWRRTRRTGGRDGLCR